MTLGRTALGVLAACAVLLGVPALQGLPGPPCSQGGRILSPDLAVQVQLATRTLFEAGTMPGALRLGGVRIDPTDIEIRLSSDDGSACTIRMSGTPSTEGGSAPDAAPQGRGLALVPHPDARCREAGLQILAVLDPTLARDPWVPCDRPRTPEAAREPGSRRSRASLPLALAAAAISFLVTGIGLATALWLHRKAPSDGDPEA